MRFLTLVKYDENGGPPPHVFLDSRDFDGIQVPGGAKSPVILSQDERIKAFVRSIAQAGKLVACISRGALLAANAGVVRGRHLTGFVGDNAQPAQQYSELAVEPTVVACGGIWENRNVVVDGNFISSRHPKDSKFFTSAIVQYLWRGEKISRFDDGFTAD